MATTSLSPSERSYILTGLSHPTTPTRIDGRQLLESRSIKISYGDAPQASGSARVSIGETQVLAGIRLEVEDITEGGGSSSGSWRTRVEVDVSPQAFPQLQSSALSTLSTHLKNILVDHFVPSVTPFPIVPDIKYFVPHLHLTVLSNGANLLTALTLASRAAFIDLRIPRTKAITLQGFSTETETIEGEDAGEKDYSGIKAAVRAGRGGKGKGRASAKGGDWELENGSERVKGSEGLPVLVTLHLIPGSQAVFIDATTQEESACPDRLYCFFNGKGNLCGLRMEGNSALEQTRIKGLLLEAKRISGELFTSLADISS